MAKKLFASKPISYRIDRKSRVAVKLKDEINKKLFDILGNYSDDVLAEYIVVLVCNGKHQNQARDDLKDFLGDDSENFVAWLWDHLATENYISSTHMNALNTKPELGSSYEHGLNKEINPTCLPALHTHSSKKSSIPLVQVVRNNPSYYPTEVKKERWEPKLIEVTARRLTEPTLVADYITNIKSNSTLHQSIPLRREHKAATELRSVVTGEDSAMRNSTRKRGNVWDRLGKPINKDHDESIAINSHEAEDFQNPRSILIKQENGLNSCLAGQKAGLDNFDKVVHTFDAVADLPYATKYKRKRPNNEFNSGNRYASVAIQAKEALNANHISSKEENVSANHMPAKDKVEDIKSKLRQMEADVLKLRSKQAVVRNVGKPDDVAAMQNQSEEDIESRTVLVTNVHFAASKEALLSHFAKCGTISKVVTLTDTITAQPKGAAYIVFSSKDSVDKALSMSRSSFFSRILTVMRKADMPPNFLVPSVPSTKLLKQRSFNQFDTPWKSSTASAQKNYYASPHLQWRRDDNLAGNRENTVSAASKNV